MNQYYALIGDIIESRRLANRAQQQEALSQVLDNLNDRYQAHLASRFSLTLGDEFQGLVKVGAPIFQMIDELRLALPELNLRFGLGLGEILTSINPALSLGADGPAYWRAHPTGSSTTPLRDSPCLSGDGARGPECDFES